MSKLLTIITFCLLIWSNNSLVKISQPSLKGLLKNSAPLLKPLDLGNAAGFAILSQTGVTDVPASSIVGNVGSYPITGAAVLLTCPEVAGTIFQSDAMGPSCFVTNPTFLLAAVGDMGTAFTKANLLVNPNFLELNAGDISGLTLSPGLYNWSSFVVMNSNVNFKGSPDDVWIFTIAGYFAQAGATQMILQEGAKSSNIFWIISGYVEIGVGSVFQGNILSAGLIALTTGATVNGRLLSQTAVTLQMNTIVIPSS